MRVLKKADFQVISVVFLSKTTISGSKMRFFYHKTCFSTVSSYEGVEKGRFSSYFCSFFIKNHHIWQQNEVFLP
jgi:hypothetical protein